jgi:antitoxin YefM
MLKINGLISVGEAKKVFFDLVQRIEDKQEIIAVTRGGVPSAVLLSMDQFQGLMETIEILSDQKTMRGLRLSLKQAEKGHWVSHDTVFSGTATKSSW